MAFRADNFTVTTMLLMAFNVAMMWVRQKRNLDNNWPVLYWFLVILFSLIRPEETFNFYILAAGLACGLMLRFEFMNRFFVRAVTFVEFLVFCYVLIRGFQIITT